ncbi:Membrane-associated progesterone receptor component 1 [Saguinus oedipus]|uniref:Membrane-associated progesterone receptor component 1 n=1 Tax=Saguinus oedipus TaxID=9490 RepID=A0ABQ9TG76_SAGOE|nr:Membrane-associated progesterone receptor component 1 [Saguinus oedipus]
MAAEDVVAMGADPSELENGGLLHEIFTSPLNLLLLGLCIFLLYKIVRGDQPAASGDSDDDEPPPLPRLKRRDFTPAELRRFDGVQDPRILMAINGKVFDVTKGRKFYGPDKRRGPPARGWAGERRGGSGAPLSGGRNGGELGKAGRAAGQSGTQIPGPR